jgi:hypothetical protein
MSNNNCDNREAKQKRLSEKKEILGIVQSKEPLTQIQYLRENNVLTSKAVCSNVKCKEYKVKELAFKVREGLGDGWWFRCGKCTTWKSCRVDSFFSLFSLSLSIYLSLIYNWAMQQKQNDSIEVTGVAKQTLVTLHQYLRYVVTQVFDRNSIKFGGPGSIVEIDESLYIKVKHGKGNLFQKLGHFGHKYFIV